MANSPMILQRAKRASRIVCVAEEAQSEVDAEVEEEGVEKGKKEELVEEEVGGEVPPKALGVHS